MVTDTSMKVCGGKKIFKLPDLKKKKKVGEGFLMDLGSTQKHKIRSTESIEITYLYTSVVRPQKQNIIQQRHFIFLPTNSAYFGNFHIPIDLFFWLHVQLLHRRVLGQ